MIAEDVAGWLGAPVFDMVQAPGGSSREFWTLTSERGGVRVPLVMQVETGRGPFFGTAFTRTANSRCCAASTPPGSRWPSRWRCRPMAAR